MRREYYNGFEKMKRNTMYIVNTTRLNECLFIHTRVNNDRKNDSI